MSETAEAYEVETTGEVYRIAPEEDGERIGVYSRGQLRFSLPRDIPAPEVRKLVQAYALGFADGRAASPDLEGRIRDKVMEAAKRLGRAAGSLKADRP
ncbi:MAG TPA: hypothetical protein VHL98_14680 [Microvirga sp.]|jgi:hypothetical protein|nr:hypothetical protein [Microvirga sp.]